MVLYDPISQATAIVQKTPPDQVTVISYPPSVINDSMAAVGQLTDSASTRSFMQNQWRAVAENMQGMGTIISGYG